MRSITEAVVVELAGLQYEVINWGGYQTGSDRPSHAAVQAACGPGTGSQSRGSGFGEAGPRFSRGIQAPAVALATHGKDSSLLSPPLPLQSPLPDFEFLRSYF